MNKLTTKIVILLTALALIQISCKSDNPDKSLTASEYKKNGVPDLLKHWSNEELKTCLTVLNKLKSQNFYSLPRKGSERSGQVYEKIISVENSLLTTDKAEANKLMINLLQLYEDNNFERRPSYYHKELTGVIKFFIHYSDLMSKAVNEVTDTSNFEVKQLLAGRERGYAKMISGALFFQSDSIALAEKDMILLAESFIPSLESNWGSLSQISKEELMPDLKSISQNHPSSIIRNKYQKFLEGKN